MALEGYYLRAQANLALGETRRLRSDDKEVLKDLVMALAGENRRLCEEEAKLKVLMG